MSVTVSPTAAAAMAGDGANKGLLALLAAATVTFFKGSQPASPETAPGGGNTSYGVLTLGTPGATEAAGVLTLAIASQGGILAGNGTDQPTWCRIATAGGTGLIDADCATAGGTITVAANWVMGGTIVYTGGITITVPSN